MNPKWWFLFVPMIIGLVIEVIVINHRKYVETKRKSDARLKSIGNRYGVKIEGKW